MATGIRKSLNVLLESTVVDFFVSNRRGNKLAWTAPLIAIFLVVITSCETHGQNKNTPSSLKGKGVIYQLTIWKSAMEAIMSQNLNRGTPPDNLNKMQSEYSKIKSLFDAATNQFLYEMNRKNCLQGKFHKIDDAFKQDVNESARYKNESINIFGREINYFVKEAQKFVKEYETSFSRESMMSSVDPLALGTLIWTVYKDIKDLQGKKADGLSSILNGLKLSSLSDLKSK